MRSNDIADLLKQRPGYEATYLLLQSNRRRQELAEYTDTDGGTLQRWLDRAEQEGFVTRDVFIQDEEKYVEYALDCELLPELVSIVDARGGRGPRDSHPDFADTISVHYWSDPYSLEVNDD